MGIWVFSEIDVCVSNKIYIRIILSQTNQTHEKKITILKNENLKVQPHKTSFLVTKTSQAQSKQRGKIKKMKV